MEDLMGPIDALVHQWSIIIGMGDIEARIMI